MWIDNHIRKKMCAHAGRTTLGDIEEKNLTKSFLQCHHFWQQLPHLYHRHRQILRRFSLFGNLNLHFPLSVLIRR